MIIIPTSILLVIESEFASKLIAVQLQPNKDLSFGIDT